MWPRLLIIFALVTIAYGAMLPAPFKTMDDRVSIVDNPALRSARQLPAIFQQGFFKDQSYYRPLVNLSFFIEYHFFGLNSFFYNLDNLLIHAANAVLVAILASLLLGESSLGFWVGVLFAIHPVHWEAVCNIPGRAIILCAFFVLNAFIFFLLFEKRKQWPWLALSLAAFVLALLSKESAGVLPGVLAIYLWRQASSDWRAKIKLLIPYGLVIILYMGWRHHLGITHVFQTDNFQILILGFITFLRSLITHLRLFILPVDLHFDRGIAFFGSFTQWQVGTTVLCWIVIGSLLLQWRKDISAFFWFLLGWFALELLPVSQLIASIGVQPGIISTAEHFLYLPSVPVFIAAVLGVRCLSERNRLKKIIDQRIFKIGIAGFLAFLLMTAMTQGFYARSEMDMLKRSLSFEPHNARLQASIALLHVFKSDFAGAQEYFQRAVDNEPMNVRYCISLGTSLCDQQQWVECLGQYVALDDSGGYGDIIERQRKTAIEHISEELSHGKVYDDKGWFIIGIYYAKSGQMDLAIDAFSKSLAIKPGQVTALMNIASLYEAKQDWVNAAASYTQLMQSPLATAVQQDLAQQHLAMIRTHL